MQIETSSSRYARPLTLGLHCALLGYCGLAAGQQSEAVPLSSFVDRRTTEVHISGRSIVGATVASTQVPAATPELYLPVAAGDAPEICVESTAVDGSYWSRGQVDSRAVAANRGVVRFRYGDAHYAAGESNYRSAADRYRADGLAVLASIGACGSEGPRNRFAVVNRNAPGEPGPVAIVVYVNTARSDADLSYTAKDGARRSVRCAPLQTSFQRIAYDATCRLTGPFADITPAQLVLSRYGDAQGSLDFSLLLALPSQRP